MMISFMGISTEHKYLLQNLDTKRDGLMHNFNRLSKQLIIYFFLWCKLWNVYLFINGMYIEPSNKLK